MMQLGVCKLEDYRPEPTGKLSRLRWYLTKSRISYQLLRTAVPPTALQITVFELIMQQMRLNSGIYRTTFRGRFQNLDEFVNRLLATRFATQNPLKVHDWAASDCLTSVEWARTLFALYPQATLEASDLTLYLLEAQLPNGEVFILEQNGDPLQYVRMPFVIRLNPPETSSFPVNRLLSNRAQAKVAKLRDSLKIPSVWLDSDEPDLALPGLRLRKIPVTHPEAEAFRAADRRFSIHRHSAFAVSDQPADVIRSMNIFNLVYFPPERLTEGIQAVWSSLKPGGWWIVGRTFKENPPDHNVSVFEKQADGFKLIQQYGEGSEIEGFVLKYGPV